MFKKLTYKSFVFFAEQYEKYTDTFITFAHRQKRASALATWSDAENALPKTGIVMQGPLLLTDDFTVETVRLYRKLHPTASVIVSTWKNENPEALTRIRDAGAEVVLSEPPQQRGPHNINMQIVSTRAGIKQAHKSGCTYVLKSRTDLRMYAPNALAYQHALLQAFPLTNIHGQKHRIAASSLATLKYRLYGVTDISLFGHIDDMLKYWDIPLDERDFKTGDNTSLRTFAKSRICEIYLATEFLAKVNRTITWTLADSWKVFADHFVIVDAESLGLYWPKYKRFEEYRFSPQLYIPADQRLTFSEWLVLYTHNGTFNVPDHILDLPQQAPVPEGTYEI